MVEHEAHINPQDDVFASPLHSASTGGPTDVVKLLLDHGAIIKFCDEDGQMGLALALENRHAEVVRILIKSGADLASHDNCVTSLSQAEKHGHLNIVQDLLFNGADVNAQDKDLQTLLHLASGGTPWDCPNAIPTWFGIGYDVYEPRNSLIWTRFLPKKTPIQCVP